MTVMVEIFLEVPVIATDVDTMQPNDRPVTQLRIRQCSAVSFRELGLATPNADWLAKSHLFCHW